MSFDKDVERVLDNEGGYVYNIHDPGGETKYGISKRQYPNLDIKSLTKEDAKRIYKQDFWDRIDGDELPSPLSYQVFDAAVNHGIGNAIRMLQRAVGVVDDGHFGPLSHAAIRRLPTVDVVLRFNAERLDFYTQLSTWPSFGKGWVSRVANNLRIAGDEDS